MDKKRIVLVRRIEMKKFLLVNRVAIVQLVVIILFYLILRIPLMGKALWHDEIYNTSSYLSTLPTAELHLDKEVIREFNWGTDWKRQIAIHPLPISFFYYNWIRLFGESEISLHIPTILAGLFGVVILYFLGSFIFGNDVSFMATLATCFSVSHIMYSVQAVHAIFEMLIFLISLLIFYKFISTKDRNTFRLLIITNVIGISIFYHYFFYLIIQSVILWFLRERLKVRRAYFIAVILLIVLFSVFVLFNYNINRYSYEHWPKNDFRGTLRSIVYLPRAFTE